MRSRGTFRFWKRAPSFTIGLTFRFADYRYASDRGLIWVDYYTAMDAGDGSMRSEYTKDGVHPTPEGYDVMERIVLPALAHYCPAAAK